MSDRLQLNATSPFDLADAAIERYVLDDVNGVASVDGGNVVFDFVDPDGSGSTSIALAKRYLDGNQVDQLLAQEDVTKTLGSADRVLWPLVDQLQTVRDLYRNDASSAQHYKYDSFGKVTVGDTSLTRYLYTSREFDSTTDLQYNRARWYDAASGRFISTDPISFVARDQNLWRYVGNHSINSTDLTGLWSYEAHLEFLEKTFKGILTDDEIKQMADIGKQMDVRSGIFEKFDRELFEKMYQHYLIDDDKTPKTAFDSAQNFVEQQLSKARMEKKQREMAEQQLSKAKMEQNILEIIKARAVIYLAREREMEALAKAMHTIMDSTSKAHADKNGWPMKPDESKHSPNDSEGDETTKHITKEIMEKTKKMMEEAYEAYKNNKKFEFETSKGYPNYPGPS